LADKCEGGSWEDPDAEVFKDGHQWARWVAERDIAQLDVSQHKAQLLACLRIFHRVVNNSK